MKSFDQVITFAREEHARYLASLRESPADEPLPHVYLWNDKNEMSMFALAIDSTATMDFYQNLRLKLQAKILLEGMVAAVYCGIVIKSPPLPPYLQRLVEEKQKTDPNFLVTYAKEHGLVNREAVMATAESASHQFVLEQEYHVRDGQLHLDGDPVERVDKGVPPLPHCRWKWPALKEAHA